MKKIVLLMGVLLVGCSSPDSDPIKQEQESVLKEEGNNVQNEPTKLEFSEVSELEPVEKIGIRNDEEIVKSAGVPAKKIIDSVDTVGEPKKIYQFADSVFGTQIELSRSQILLAWIAVNEDESSRTQSLESIAIAQHLARAMLGIEGGKLVDETTTNGKIEPQAVDSYQITMGTCISGLCSLKIQR